MEKHKDAIKCYDQVHKLNPKNISAWNNKGIALRTLGRFHEAIKCFDETIKINEDYEWGWHNKGFTLGELGQLNEAIKCYDRALKINPNYQSAIRNRQRCVKIIELQKKEATLATAALETKDMTPDEENDELEETTPNIIKNKKSNK